MRCSRQPVHSNTASWASSSQDIQAAHAQVQRDVGLVGWHGHLSAEAGMLWLDVVDASSTHALLAAPWLVLGNGRVSMMEVGSQ